MEGALPRKKKENQHHLTLIPEESNPITHRFNVALVSDRAKDFAEAVVNSEFAEAYRPKATKSTDDLHAKKEEEQEDPFVLFCPTGVACTRELARLRFQLCAHFSDDLPVCKDKAQALSIIVVLLFWKKQSVGEAISDFRTRIAEIAHLPSPCRPITALVAFSADGEQEQKLRDFVDAQKVKISADFFPEDDEDSLSDALQTLCERAVRDTKMGRGSMRFSSADIASAVTPHTSACGCCVS